MYYVVGSGPSGVMCARALLDKGLPVTMIDVGLEIEPDRLATVRQLAQQLPETWDPVLVKRVQGDFRFDTYGIPTKLAYGSDFSYAEDERIGLTQDNTKCCVSFARGGLSNVWGAAMLPCTENDFKNWPVSLEEMAPHYASVAREVAIAGCSDDLAAVYPFYAPPLRAAPLSRQATYLLNTMSANKDKLRRKGFIFGKARLAMRTEPGDRGLDCQRCGLCLTGCPYMTIYNSTQTLGSLLKRSSFRYINGLVVRRVENAGERVLVYCHPLDSSESVVFQGKRVFLACGVLSSVKIILASLGLARAELLVRYQPYFLLPMCMRKNFRGVESERLHTLSQLFLEVVNKSISEEVIHLQIYTYNEMMRRQLSRVLLGAKKVSGQMQKLLLGRLIAMQGYLSGHCARGITLYVAIQHGGASIKMSTRGEIDAETVRTIRRVARELLFNGVLIGAWPLWPMMKIGMPGDGNHIGAVFPMTRTPVNFESDSYGRIRGLGRVHVVDASVLTTLPATTLTYTVMANARRIASISADLDR